MFILQNAPRPPLTMAGLVVESIKVETGFTPYELTLAVTDRSDGLRLQLEYNTDLFDRETIVRLLGHYRTLLEAVVADPDQSISCLPLLKEAERRQLLYEWNHTAVHYDDSRSLIQLFEARAAAQPEATAFILGEQRLSYAELNQRANQVAHALQAWGAGAGAVVGLCLERSLAAVVGLLGIFKAGTVYLPLDPAYPAARLAFMLQDAQATLLVTQQKFLALVANSAGTGLPGNLSQDIPENGASVSGKIRPLCLDSDGDFIARQSPANPGRYASAGDLAYVIYTSGSTGRPKGVAVPHRQILNRLYWMWQAYPFAPGEVGCQKTALNFVDSLWELFGPLLQGVPTVIVPDQTLKEPEALVETLARHEVSRLWFVPSFLRLLLDTVPDLAQRLPKLTFWVSSGEALTWDLYRHFRAQMPHATLYNLYGTSEVWDVTWYTPDLIHESLAHVPIGRPIANMTTYILDEQRQPVPIGVPGELYVGGVGLAQGYLNRPGLTAERFIGNPESLVLSPQSLVVSPQSSVRNTQYATHNTSSPLLYKTGDRARYLPDGNIEFLGRQDAQLKLRGYRVEPGEIETCLRGQAAVKDAVVVAWDQPGSDDRQLVAYLVVQAEAALETADVRRRLQAELPGHMIPNRFMVLDRLPLTPSGKVNRRALPAPDGARQDGMTFVAPRDSVEQRLAQVWQEALAVTQVGVDDNFFDLGGHSLLAVRLFARIEAEFGHKLPLAMLFQSPTLAQLASFLRQPQAATWSSLVPIQPQGHASPRPPLFCVHGVGGHVLRYQALARSLGPDQPLYGLQSLGLAGNTPPHETIEAMAAHYLEAIRSLQPEGPYLLGGLSLGGFVALEMGRQLLAQGQPVALLALLDISATLAPRYFTALSQPARLRFHVRNLQEKVHHHRHVLATLPPQEKVRYVWRRLGQHHDPTIDKVALGVEVPASEPVMWQVMQANRRALGRYRPRPYPGKITLFKSIEDGRGRHYGWDELALVGVEVHEIPGSHISIVQEPHVHTLAEKLNDCIAKVL